MAILRGGRRIGNMDIRLGIPRDRSLDNVAGDKRLNRKFGGNPESTLGRFMGFVHEGEGFARPNRYLVDFILPRGVDLGMGDLTNLPPSERIAKLALLIPISPQYISSLCSPIRGALLYIFQEAELQIADEPG